MPQKTNLNVSPYYDDYDPTKNYYRILTRPTYAVQARELTQSQSILQNQIEKFADHIFKEGTIVSGVSPSLDNSYNYIRLFDSANSVAVTVSNFANATIQGVTMGVKARVVAVHDGAQANTPNMKTLYFKYISAGTDGTTKTFAPGERVFSTANVSLIANVFNSASSIGNSSIVLVSNGVIYARGTFISVGSSKLVISKYNNHPDIRVGFDIEESLVSATDDSTLYDPAVGSYNYTAPGADRLKLEPVLTTKSLTAANTDTFFQILSISNGQIQSAYSTTYNQLGDELARRTYDESGNYSVKQFAVEIKEHLKSGNNGGIYTSTDGGNTNKLVVSVEPGKAYVNGYEYENIRTKYIPIDKATSYIDLDAQNITANYGNYTYVHSVAGDWDINNLGTINLHSAVANATARLFTSNTAVVGTTIGTARVRSIVYSSGNFYPDGTAQYKLYLSDIRISGASKSFADVRSVSFTSGTKRGLADITLNSDHKAQLYDTTFNGSIFPLPQNTIRRLRDSSGTIDTTIIYKKSIPVSIAAGGTFSINLSGETFNEGTGTLNSSQKTENFIVTLTQNAVSTMTGTITSAISNTITGSGTLFDRAFRAGDLILFGTNNYVRRIVSIASNTSMTITPQGPVTKAALAFSKVFPKGHVIDLTYTAQNTSYKNRSVILSTSTAAAFDIKETLTGTATANVTYVAVKSAAREIAKTVKKNRYVRFKLSTATNTTVGPWSLGVSDAFSLQEVRQFTSAPGSLTGGTDVTDHFVLDSGQRDDQYEHASIRKRPGSTLVLSSGDFLLVKFTYFTHDYSQGFGYFSVDSYPVDDVNASNTNAITTATIPVYTSPTTHKVYGLRNVIDIRPAMTNTANDVTSLTNISTNPANSSTINISTSARVLVPNENITCDISYYLPRIDKLSLNSKGAFIVSRGTPSLNPREPDELPSSMTIAVINIPPYPSVSPAVAKQVGSTQYMTTVRILSNQRYTMRDIGALKNRIENLEYYTSLSMMELSVLSKQFLNSSGVDRFKNGIFVDGFDGHNKTDTSTADFKASIDPLRRLLRPTFDLTEVPMDYSSDSSNVVNRPKDVRLTITTGTGLFSNNELINSSAGGVTGYLFGKSTNTRLYLENTTGTWAPGQTLTGATSGATGTVTAVSFPAESKIYTLPYTHNQIISQQYATKVRNAAGDYWFFFRGTLSLNPESDTWYDTVYTPDINTTVVSDRDNILNQINNGSIVLGTSYGDWQSWSGVVSEEVNVTRTETAETNRQDDWWAADALSAGVTTVHQDWNTATTTTYGAATYTATGGSTRSVQSTSLVFDSSTNLIDDTLVSTAVIPFMRSKMVQFTAIGLAPSTKHHAFFDSVAVGSYCRPATSAFANTGGEGAALTSDSSGNLYGFFRIPNNDAQRFRTGQRTFFLTDNSNTTSVGVAFSTAEAKFASAGTLATRQKSFLTTRVPRIETTSSTESSSWTNEWTAAEGIIGQNTVQTTAFWVDPVAQSFMAGGSNVPSGNYFLSRLDLYFKSKSATMPVTVEIRSMDNGFPSTTIIPNGIATLQPADVNVSNDSSIPTPFYFDGMPCLTTGNEFCFVVKPGGNSPDYEIWVSELGAKDILTSRVITEQPYLGVLFTSSNDRTWTAYQKEDIKFRMYAADFDTSVTGSLVVKNDSSNYFNVANVNADFYGSEPLYGEVRVRTSVTANTGAGNPVVGQAVLGMTSRATGYVTNISGTTGAVNTIYRIRDNTTSRKFVQGEVVRFATGCTATVTDTRTPEGLLKYYRSTFANSQIHIANTATRVVNATGTIISTTLSGANNIFVTDEQVTGQLSGSKAFVYSIDNQLLNTLYPNMMDLKFANTTLDYSVKTSTASALGSTFESIVNKQNNDFIIEEKRLFSKQNEVTTLSGAKSLQLKATMTSSDPFLSPVVDLQRASVFAISNVINNANTSETSATGGSAKAKYISRPVVLADGQDAEDIKLVLTAFRPPTADIKVYIKILNGSDSTLFKDRPWQVLEMGTAVSTIYSDSQSGNFNEYDFNFPTSVKTGSAGEVQYTATNGATYTGYKIFAIKIVMLSSVTYNPPIIKDLRAVALQV